MNTWSGSQVIDHTTITDHGSVQTSTYNNPIDIDFDDGDDGPGDCDDEADGGCECEPENLTGVGQAGVSTLESDCEEDLVSTPLVMDGDGPCDDEIYDWGWDSVEMMGATMIAVGSTTVAVTNPEPVTKTAATLIAIGGWIALASAVNDFVESTVDVLECAHAD